MLHHDRQLDCRMRAVVHAGGSIGVEVQYQDSFGLEYADSALNANV